MSYRSRHNNHCNNHVLKSIAPPPSSSRQALLANIAAMYAIYHGPDGIRKIADRVHSLTVGFAEGWSCV